MKSLLHAAVAAALTLVSVGAIAEPAEPAVVVAERGGDALGKLVPRWMRDARIPGAAIAYVQDGQLQTVEVFGQRADGVPMTADARFNVASLTKPVFGLLTMRLVADGQLTLDTPLAKHWVDPDIADDPHRLALTPRLMLSHQSGFPNWRNDRLEFQFEPGSRHEYSGEGYEYLRKAIEKMTGQGMRELMEAQVLKPAGMRHTSFGWSDAVSGHEVTGYDEAGKARAADLRQFEANAAAHMLTTIGDYARFTRWVIDGAGLPPSLLREMAQAQAQHDDPAENFGLGWRLVRVGADTVLSHDGREPGLRTQVFVAPASREALVILTNSAHGELLVHPVAAATLKAGVALNRQVALDTWKFLQAVPGEQMQPMVEGISRSPSFMSKLLYAVDAKLLAESPLSVADKRRVHAAIDPFVLGMVGGKTSIDDAKAMFALLLETDASGTRLRRSFDQAQAQAWIAGLERPLQKRAVSAG
jgi:CubicO group peptidase (beta-lactamase class C family)